MWTSEFSDVAKFWDQTQGAVQAQAPGRALMWVNAYFRRLDNEKKNFNVFLTAMESAQA